MAEETDDILQLVVSKRQNMSKFNCFSSFSTFDLSRETSSAITFGRKSGWLTVYSTHTQSTSDKAPPFVTALNGGI